MHLIQKTGPKYMLHIWICGTDLVAPLNITSFPGWSFEMATLRSFSSFIIENTLFWWLPCWESRLVQVGCWERKGDVQSFPVRVRELSFISYPKFYARLSWKLNFWRSIWYAENTVLFFFSKREKKVVILLQISVELIREPFVFITYSFWKLLRKPGMQMNQVTFDTSINSNVTCLQDFSPENSSNERTYPNFPLLVFWITRTIFQ